MNTQKSELNLYVLFGAVIVWFALILQFYLSITLSKDIPVLTSIVRYFSFFTVLTNILVALCLTFALVRKRSPLQSFFSNYCVVSGVALNILIVAILYHLLLSGVWDPKGWQLVADILLHTINPILFLIYWVITDKKYKLQFKDACYWLIYPFLYLIFVLILGKGTGNYPYYFIDVKELGYTQALLNSFWIMIAFVVTALLFVGINRIIIKSSLSK